MEKEVMNILKNIKKVNVLKITNTLRKQIKKWFYMLWLSIHIRYDGSFYIDENNYNQWSSSWTGEFVLSYDVRNIRRNTKEELQERIRSDYNQEVILYVRNNLYIDKDDKWKLYIRY